MLLGRTYLEKIKYLNKLAKWASQLLIIVSMPVTLMKLHATVRPFDMVPLYKGWVYNPQIYPISFALLESDSLGLTLQKNQDTVQSSGTESIQVEKASLDLTYATRITFPIRAIGDSSHTWAMHLGRPWHYNSKDRKSFVPYTGLRAGISHAGILGVGTLPRVLVGGEVGLIPFPAQAGTGDPMQVYFGGRIGLEGFEGSWTYLFGVANRDRSCTSTDDDAYQTPSLLANNHFFKALIWIPSLAWFALGVDHVSARAWKGDQTAPACITKGYTLVRLCPWISLSYGWLYSTEKKWESTLGLLLHGVQRGGKVNLSKLFHYSAIPTHQSLIARLIKPLPIMEAVFLEEKKGESK